MVGELNILKEKQNKTQQNKNKKTSPTCETYKTK